eukprot:CAMPEP_0174316848 /NCGR_PEP_ID=MMETSP0810-20121108/7224_1 /TAXON_ID=73025 ORGANISM="Eutreptiella gymnastica-like, Strain CCMP1594" /NCGR_SAMPLE_ID=MMETSP0810 /ASSEMBLY_ACC=CAM_ASM_000659 /LENGTH=79 /DNA_ID=CAMNT_0015426699 /DNA_START=46 /DNA_END=285 /DNA_ORIENTATION=-
MCAASHHVAPFDVLGLSSAAWCNTRETAMMQCAWCADGTLTCMPCWRAFRQPVPGETAGSGAHGTHRANMLPRLHDRPA